MEKSLSYSVIWLEPSKDAMCLYLGYSKRGVLTVLGLMSSITDLLAGNHISHTAKEALKDLKLLTPSGKPNKRAKEILAHYLHEKFHNDNWGVALKDIR
jgi:hypothetical protein